MLGLGSTGSNQGGIGPGPIYLLEHNENPNPVFNESELPYNRRIEHPFTFLFWVININDGCVYAVLSKMWGKGGWKGQMIRLDLTPTLDTDDQGHTPSVGISSETSGPHLMNCLICSQHLFFKHGAYCRRNWKGIISRPHLCFFESFLVIHLEHTILERYNHFRFYLQFLNASHLKPGLC